MSNTLQSIMIDLKNWMAMHENVTNLNLVTQAIDRLELYPMSMVQLEETRVAQLLQMIRRQVETPLQKRIRAIIKAWQKLLEPGSAYATIIPRDKRSLTASNPVLSSDHQRTVCSTSNSPGVNDNSNNNGERLNAAVNAHQLARPARPRLSVSSSPSSAMISSPVKPLHHLLDRSNGSAPAVASPKVNGQTYVPPPHSDKRPSLAKVKSTAELMQEAGGCIDSITKDRILSNRITKESDEYPRVVPPSVGRTPRQPRATTIAKQASQYPSPTPPPPVHRAPLISVAKSEMMDKFLESTFSVQQHQRAGDVVDEDQRNHQHKTIIPVDSTTDNLDRQDQNQKIDIESKHHHKDKKRHKRKVKHDSGDGHISKHHRRRTESGKAPVPNRMDDWPILPKIDQVNVEMGERHSGETPTPQELSDSNNVTRLLTDTWPEVNSVRDGEGHLQPMTSLFSVGLDEDQLVHVLPWVNLSEYRRSFFPSESSELDHLVDLPEPW